MASDTLDQNQKDDEDIQEGPESALNDQNEHDVMDASAFLDQQKCGITVCGLQFCSSFLELATHGRFLTVLSLLAILEGIIHGYFVSFLHDNAIHMSSSVISYLLQTSGLVQIVFTFLFGYIGARRHKTLWISNVAAFIWVSAIFIGFILVSYDWSRFQSNFVHRDSALCQLRSDVTSFLWTKHWLLIFFFFLLQVGVGLSNVAYMSLGLSYLDDNIGPWRSPLFIGVAMAAKTLGPQLGHTISSWNAKANVPAVFVFSSLFWIFSGISLIVISLTLSMFPNKLLPLHDNDGQVPLSINRVNKSAYSHASGFLGSLERIVSNKMVIYNALASMCLHTVDINFGSIRASYLQTVFYIPSSMDFLTSIQHRFITDFLRVPSAALVLILTGYLIKKYRPMAPKLARWNIIATILAICIIFITVMIKCQRTRLYASYNNSLDDYCNKNCHCDSLKFLPVCSPDGSTMYFSPCHAGCKVFRDVKHDLYGNCRCVATEKASSSYCHKDYCLLKSLAYQLLDLIVSCLLISCRVGSMLLCFRCVGSKDKPLVVSLEIFIAMLFAFIPGKYLYSMALSESCVLPDDGMHHGCKVYNAENLTTYVNLLNVCLLIAGTGFYAVVYNCVDHISLFGEEVQPRASSTKEESKSTNGSAQPYQKVTKSILVKPPRKLPVGKDADIFVNCNNPELEPLFMNISEKPLQTSPVTDLDVDSNSDRSSGITLRKGGFLTTLL
uniref:Solute carrier organic anion transporter family member 4C1 n=1 Tax=Cacopsylla melanoneura TaxID=428564 RepID=A0A8D9AUQ7_9HEMI